MLAQAVPIAIIALNSLFAIILLSQSKAKVTANLFLSAFLLAIVFQFLLIVLINAGSLPESWIPYNTVFGYLYGPSIYYYIICLIDSKYKFLVRDLLHYSPIVFVFLGLFLFPKISPFFAIFMYVSLTIYVWISFKSIQEFKRKLKAGRWKKPNSTLQWLQYFLVLFTVLLFVDLVDQVIVHLFSFEGVSIVHFGLVLLISWMFFRAFNQPDLFKENTSIFTKTKGYGWQVRTTDKAQHAEISSLKKRIENHIFESKWYLLPNLSMEEVAKKLDTTPQLLSATINTHYSLNFSSFINSLRIEHAKEMLKNFTKSEKSISEIMYDSGFVSKSSFNTIFKNETGVTPSQYRALEQ